MWRVLGLNLDEVNVNRVVGILEVVESIFELIDQDCIYDISSLWIFIEDYEVVIQIVKDLLD